MMDSLKETMGTALLETSKQSQFRFGVTLMQPKLSKSTRIQHLIGPESWLVFESLGKDVHG